MKLSDYHRIVIISVMSVLVSIYSIFYLLVYIPEMIVWFGYEEHEKGYYTGILMGCFYLGAFITNYPFGVIADTYGHRNVLMVLLVVSTVLNISLSFCREMNTLIVFRFLLGLCFAIFALSRAIVSMYSDDSNHGIAMAINMAASRFGFFLSATIGGFLVSLKGSRFFDTFPFFIPPFMGAVLGIISALTTYFMYPKDNTGSVDDTAIATCSYVHHTRERPNIKQYERLQEEAENIATSGQSEMILAAEQGETIRKSPFDTKGQHTKQCGKAEKQAHIHSNYPKEQSSSDNEENNERVQHILSGQNNAIQKGYSTFAISKEIEQFKMDKSSNTDGSDEIKMDKTSNNHHTDKTTTPKTTNHVIKSCWNTINLHVSKFVNFLTDITILRICMGGLFTILGASGYNQLFSAWLSTTPDLGGLGYTHGDIGTVSMIASLSAAVISVFFIPAMERRFGAIYACAIGLVAMMICVSVVPLARFVKFPQVVFVMMIIFHFLFWVLIALCNSFMLVILSNCVPKSQIASIHGLGQMANTLGGTLSPIVGGVIFSSSIVSDFGSPIDPSLVFVLFGSMFWIATIIFVTLPSSLNHMPKDELGNRI